MTLIEKARTEFPNPPPRCLSEAQSSTWAKQMTAKGVEDYARIIALYQREPLNVADLMECFSELLS